MARPMQDCIILFVRQLSLAETCSIPAIPSILGVNVQREIRSLSELTRLEISHSAWQVRSWSPWTNQG